MELLYSPGEIIAQRYRIVDSLGQGGSGTTYLAEDLQSSQPVALKALSLRHTSDWKAIELFEREARVLAQLNHPAIPRYLEYFHVDTPQNRSFYIAQQLAPGQSLAMLVDKGWRASQEEVRGIAIQILEILVYLHELTPPVIHRDIKPQNIIRHPDGQVFLVDFGAVQDTYYNTFMRGSTVVGTYGYMAPEQFRGQAVPTTDLYGLGATLLFLLTHRSPAELPTDELKLDFRSRVQISQEFADWLEKMLEPDVEDRFSSAKEALLMLRGKQMTTIRPSSPVPWKTIVGVGVAAVAATAAVTVLNSHKWAILGNLGFTPPGRICESADAIRDYLNQEGNPNAVLNSYRISNDSLLACAARNEYKDIAKLLIAKGADVNARLQDDYTPLHIVNSQEIAQLLIAKGADIHAKAENGSTPLHVVESLEVAQLLIAKGADIHAKAENGMTPLHEVAGGNWIYLHVATHSDLAGLHVGEQRYHSNKEIVELLLAKGADVNVKSNNGITPLHSAVQSSNAVHSSNKDIVELLLAKGADINANDNEGMTPLHLAVQNFNKDIVELLLAKGAVVNAKDKYGNTPLHRVAESSSKNKDGIALLLAHGANVKAKGKKGMTPLHFAVQSFGKDEIALLIARGADVNAKDKNGNTPLRLAAKQGSTDLVQLLKRHGAKQ